MWTGSLDAPPQIAAIARQENFLLSWLLFGLLVVLAVRVGLKLAHGRPGESH
ncbi:MAG: hypothetical protein HY078_16150 [Elusimicrobia bacterium]|nr:hypothetical protein [Elusimicrobiota bacterium]